MLGLPSTAKTPAAEARQVKRCGKWATNVPGLAGIELIFFFTAVTVLCSGFRMGMMLLTHCWVAACPKQGVQSFPGCASQELHKELGGRRARTADLNWPKGHSIAQDTVPSRETGGTWPGAVNHWAETGWASLSSKTGHHLVFLFFYSFLSLLFYYY